MGTPEQHIACPPYILKAYKHGAFTDLTITCGDLSFEVHQVVVGMQCDFLKKCLKFAVGKEADEKRIDLPEDDPEMIRRLIAYLYLGDYDPCSELDIKAFANIKQHKSTTAPALTSHSRKSGFFQELKGVSQCACLAPTTGNFQQLTKESGQNDNAANSKVVEKPNDCFEVANPLTIHANMYALADKYQVEGLSQVAIRKFKSCVCHHSNSEDFVTAVQLAYSSTPDSNRGLRDVVVKAFLESFNVDITNVRGLESKLDTIDELSFLLIKSWPQKAVPSKTGAIDKATTTASATRPFGIFGQTNTPRTNPMNNSFTTPAPPSTGLFGAPRPAAGGTGNAQGNVFSLAGAPVSRP